MKRKNIKKIIIYKREKEERDINLISEEGK